jgi:hypothetical protein
MADPANPRAKSRSKSAPRAKSKSASIKQSASWPERLAFTLDTSSGEIFKLESVDSAGLRNELSANEKVKLAKESRELDLEALIEQVFEAGIACVLGDEDKNANETKEDADLRRILLKPLIEASSAAKLMRREVLRRAIIQTLIRDTIGASATGSNSDRATSKKRKQE